MSVAELDSNEQLRKAWKEAHLVPLWEARLRTSRQRRPIPPICGLGIGYGR
jgi:hypothetical protein